jgi:hypothetical protein
MSESDSDEIVLVWEELKSHVPPAEVDLYARQIGLARISRNEEARDELLLLQRMQTTLTDDIDAEISRKNPLILASPQRNTAIARACAFLDSLKSGGHVVEPTTPNDAQVLKYLKLTRLSRPSSGDQVSPRRDISSPKSARSIGDVNDNISDIQQLLDDEYTRLQTYVQDIRCQMFSQSEELGEVKALVPPTTDSIEGFSKRLHTQELVARSIAKTQGSSGVARLRDSVRLNRLWT